MCGAVCGFSRTCFRAVLGALGHGRSSVRREKAVRTSSEKPLGLWKMVKVDSRMECQLNEKRSEESFVINFILQHCVPLHRHVGVHLPPDLKYREIMLISLWLHLVPPMYKMSGSDLVQCEDQAQCQKICEGRRWGRDDFGACTPPRKRPEGYRRR